MKSNTLISSLVLVFAAGAAVPALAAHQSPRGGNFETHAPIVLADASSAAIVAGTRLIMTVGCEWDQSRRGPHYRRG